MHYYQFNIGDYASSTQHLDPIEDIAYRRMLDLYYSKESPLPKDIEQIARLIRMRSHKDSIAIVLDEFFSKEKDGYHNKGADKALERVYKKSEAARKSAEARWNKNKDLESCERIANASETQCENNADGMLPNTHNPIPNTHNKDLLSDKSDAVEVLNYLVEITGVKYRSSTKSHIQNISARLSDGYTVDDCKAVIDFKNKEWGSDQKMSGYLRPQTLFSASKFPGYAKASKTKPNQGVNAIGSDFSAPDGWEEFE